METNRERLETFLTKVLAAYEALTVLKADPLCAPGVRGMRDEMLELIFVPKIVLEGFRDGIDSVWENGWDF